MCSPYAGGEARWHGSLKNGSEKSVAGTRDLLLAKEAYYWQKRPTTTAKETY